jgi:hypothetical protein
VHPRRGQSHRPTPPLAGVYPFEGKAGNGPAEREEYAMAEFIFIYRTPAEYTLGTPDGIAVWNAWFQGMGSQLRDLGKPVFNRAAVGDSAVGALLGGYSLVTAENRHGRARKHGLAPAAAKLVHFRRRTLVSDLGL